MLRTTPELNVLFFKREHKVSEHSSWESGEANTVSSPANWADGELTLSVHRVRFKLSEGTQFCSVAELRGVSLVSVNTPALRIESRPRMLVHILMRFWHGSTSWH